MFCDPIEQSKDIRPNTDPAQQKTRDHVISGFARGAKGIRTPRSHGGKLLVNCIYGSKPTREITPQRAT
jgi:hypothetical protein